VRNLSLPVIPGQSGDTSPVRTDPPPNGSPVPLVHVIFVAAERVQWSTSSDLIGPVCAYGTQHFRPVTLHVMALRQGVSS
jgi:hypothetical protein